MAFHDEFYVCQCCGDRCKSAWTEEEARAEAKREFPDLDIDGPYAAIICDDCYRKLMGRAADKIN